VGAVLAWAGSSNGLEVNEFPIFALGIGIAYVLQWLIFIPSYLTHSERYFDLTGSLTFITVSALVLFVSNNINQRSIILVLFIAIWAFRLGAFLFSRINKAGEDRRFREIKQSFPRFLMAWTLQGLWVSFSLAAALAAISSSISKSIGIIGSIGILLWIIGFFIEVVADRQKNIFRADPKNTDQYISTGLWAWSRHPNYFGEILLWFGIAILAYPVLQGWQKITLLSPIFVFILLTRISGIPMLERRALEKWGRDKNYVSYKANTPVLFPRCLKKQKTGS
jgi:steroid 5-alpha reductase family enzyme